VNAASAHLARIGAASRPAGSAGAVDARAYCAAVLRAAGFAISEQSFEYSAFPASWGMPVSGLVAAVGAGTLYLERNDPVRLIIAGLVLVAAFALLAVVGRRGVLDYPLMRRRGVNLQATRPGIAPTVWLVAHLDSKWQPVSMIARVLGVVGTSVGLVAVGVLSFLPATARAPWLAVLALTWLSALPLMLSVVGARNHGTLDNASGVAAVLEAAESIAPAVRAGVLITDAEELALAGALAWSKTQSPAVALNCDSIDDAGPLVVMYSGARPEALIARFQAAAGADGVPRVLRLIPGILTDSVALAAAGWQTLTLSRGTVRTLQRIHTSRDTLSAMKGTGIAGAARVLARMATELG
jgi:Peptidase family M28